MKYLLDTNAISHFMKFPEGAVARRVQLLRPEEFGTSIIVRAELKFGARKRGSKGLEDRIEEVLASLIVAPWESPSDVAYAGVRTQLEASGQPVGQNDMLIAAHAITLGATLVTDNDREFSRVRGLRVENWLRAG